MVSRVFIMVAVWAKQQASSNPLNILSSLMTKTFNSSSIDIALNVLIFEYIGKYTEDHRFLFCGLFILIGCISFFASKYFRDMIGLVISPKAAYTLVGFHRHPMECSGELQQG